jgi:hypothetical protein
LFLWLNMSFCRDGGDFDTNGQKFKAPKNADSVHLFYFDPYQMVDIFLDTYIYMYNYTYTCITIYIYYIPYIYIHTICVYIYIHTMCIYIHTVYIHSKYYISYC